jgi:hypothetical protein
MEKEKALNGHGKERQKMNVKKRRLRSDDRKEKGTWKLSDGK